MVSAPKYARIASERRFLLRELLADLDLGDLIRIVDSCWPGTRMRLRRMERRDGEIIQLKLIQKYFERGRSMMEMMITHPYLNQAEYALFHQLAGNQLFKRRSRYLHRGSGYRIDQFDGQLKGFSWLTCWRNGWGIDEI